MKTATAFIVISLFGTQAANAAGMSQLQEEVNRLVMASYQQSPSSGIIGTESSMGGNGLQLRVLVEGDGKGWSNIWGEKVCSSPAIRRMLAMGGRLTILAEDAAKKRRGEMAFGAEFCATLGKPIQGTEAVRSNERPTPAPAPRPQSAPSPR